LNPGDLIQSRYRLARLLGAGASGAVWAARNELIDRDVALKIMRPEVAEDAVALQRFFNEAKASGRVRSSSIVEILDLGQAEDGSPFLVFELLYGEGLDSRLKREGTIPPEQLLEYMIGVTKALDLAHSQGIIHRDLKPANIFLHRLASGDSVAKILDFGISKVFDTGQNFSLTRTGMVVGSPAYMSPEQAAGREDIDGRADLWSLGVVMFEALTGTLPYEAANYNALMVRILTQDTDPIQTRKTDLPQPLCAIVDASSAASATSAPSPRACSPARWSPCSARCARSATAPRAAAPPTARPAASSAARPTSRTARRWPPTGRRRSSSPRPSASRSGW
jgi:serine/threonine protein kinase